MDIKFQFPIFKNHLELVYLDNASTTQKPQSVIDRITNFYENENANVYRGMYPLSQNATRLMEDSRRKVAEFINAKKEEIVFVANATAGLNLIANGIIQSGLVSNSPRVLVTELEHSSSLLPWMQAGAEIEYIKLDEDYNFQLSNLPTNIDVVAVNLASNVTGTVLSIKKIRQHYPEAIIIADATQAIAHFQLDVKDLDIDFLAVSGHKLYGPTGIGFIYGKYEVMDKIPPQAVGGGMTSSLTKLDVTWKKLPSRLEAGTPAIAQIVGLAEAINFIQQLGWSQISSQEQEHREYLIQQLNEFSNIQIMHSNQPEAIGVVSFHHSHIHAHDIADLLGQKNIAVRSGQHCAQIIHSDVWHIPATTRVSLGVYNQKSDIDKLIEELYSIEKIFSL